jgi:hypothetical protein
MNIWILLNLIQIVGYASFAYAPFQKNRIRKAWAKKVFILISIVGVIKGSVGLAYDSGWFTLGINARHLLHDYLTMTGGFLIALILLLVVSGQIKGEKRD